METKQLPERAAWEADVVSLFMRDVDVLSSVKQLGGVEDYLELIDLFDTDSNRRLSLLDELREKRDIERYTIEVHGLKSASANIGAGKLSAMARRHEEAGKAADWDWIIENLPSLTNSYHGLLDEIQRVLSAHGYGRFAQKDLSNLPAIEPQEVGRRLNTAIEALEDFESKQALQEVEALLEFAVPDDMRPKLEQAQSLLKVYEDEQAEELLRALTEPH